MNILGYGGGDADLEFEEEIKDLSEAEQRCAFRARREKAGAMQLDENKKLIESFASAEQRSILDLYKCDDIILLDVLRDDGGIDDNIIRKMSDRMEDARYAAEKTKSFYDFDDIKPYKNNGTTYNDYRLFNGFIFPNGKFIHLPYTCYHPDIARHLLMEAKIKLPYENDDCTLLAMDQFNLIRLHADRIMFSKYLIVSGYGNTRTRFTKAQETFLDKLFSLFKSSDKLDRFIANPWVEAALDNDDFEFPSQVEDNESEPLTNFEKTLGRKADRARWF